MQQYGRLQVRTNTTALQATITMLNGWGLAHLSETHANTCCCAEMLWELATTAHLDSLSLPSDAVAVSTAEGARFTDVLPGILFG